MKIVYRAIGRALDLTGVSIVAVLVASPIVSLAWVAYRVAGFETAEGVRRAAIIVAALAAVAGIVAIGMVRADRRAGRNADKPAQFTWEQWELGQRLNLRLGVLSVLIGLAGVALAVPAHV